MGLLLVGSNSPSISRKYPRIRVFTDPYPTGRIWVSENTYSKIFSAVTALLSIIQDEVRSLLTIYWDLTES